MIVSEENPLARRARSELLRAAAGSTIVCHCSSSLAGETDGPVQIQHVVCKTLGPRSRVEVFDSRQGGELAALTALQDFVRAHESDGVSTTWLHWRMRGPTFGLDALANRYRLLCGTNAFSRPAERLDLSETIPWIYGPDYADHPRLPSLMALNGMTGRGMLTEREAAEAFRRRDFQGLIRNTVQRVEGIGRIFELAVSGRLKTARPRDLAGISGTDCIDYSAVIRKKPVAISPGQRVMLFGSADCPIVDGREVRPLSRAAYRVVTVLLEAGDLGLSKDQLVTKSGHSDARGILVRLKRQPCWSRLIDMAGSPGRGYRIL